MILTRDHKSVWASFDRPREYRKIREFVHSGWLEIDYEFQVGPVTYEVGLSGKEGRWIVVFEVTGITGTDEELIEFFSRVYREEVILEDIPKIKSRIKKSRMGDLNLGNASEVIATVIAVMRDVASRHPIKCLEFSATTNKKASLYRRLIRAFLSDWEVVYSDDRDFEVCRKT